MSKLEFSVCLSPLLLSNYAVEKSAVVVVDILRATTTIVTALASGMQAVYPVQDVGQCLELKQKIANSVSAGERDGKILPGLDMGNEPLSYVGEHLRGKSLVLTTTNGTKLIYRAKELGARKIVIGAMLNLRATCNYLQELGLPVIIACAGWKDLFNVEDTFYAGALLSVLREYSESNCDSALLARILFDSYAECPEILLRQSSHYQRLDRYSKANDLDFCIKPDVYDIVATYDGEKISIVV